LSERSESARIVISFITYVDIAIGIVADKGCSACRLAYRAAIQLVSDSNTTLTGCSAETGCFTGTVAQLAKNEQDTAELKYTHNQEQDERQHQGEFKQALTPSIGGLLSSTERYIRD
jgi:hypothetical protein